MSEVANRTGVPQGTVPKGPSRVLGMVEHDVAEDDVRVDPDDGLTWTYRAYRERYALVFKLEDIRDYWRTMCLPVGTRVPPRPTEPRPAPAEANNHDDRGPRDVYQEDDSVPIPDDEQRVDLSTGRVWTFAEYKAQHSEDHGARAIRRFWRRGPPGVLLPQEDAEKHDGPSPSAETLARLGFLLQLTLAMEHFQRKALLEAFALNLLAGVGGDQPHHSPASRSSSSAAPGAEDEGRGEQGSWNPLQELLNRMSRGSPATMGTLPVPPPHPPGAEVLDALALQRRIFGQRIAESQPSLDHDFDDDDRRVDPDDHREWRYADYRAHNALQYSRVDIRDYWRTMCAPLATMSSGTRSTALPDAGGTLHNQHESSNEGTAVPVDDVPAIVSHGSCGAACAMPACVNEPDDDDDGSVKDWSPDTSLHVPNSSAGGDTLVDRGDVADEGGVAPSRPCFRTSSCSFFEGGALGAAQAETLDFEVTPSELTSDTPFVPDCSQQSSNAEEVALVDLHPSSQEDGTSLPWAFAMPLD